MGSMIGLKVHHEYVDSILFHREGSVGPLLDKSL